MNSDPHSSSLARPVRLNILRGLFFIASACVLVLIALGDLSATALIATPSQYGQYFFIGIIAAIIANSTGAGGGIVFLPAFITLGLTSEQSLSTSFAIQSFGMTSGMLAWLVFRQSERKLYPDQWQSFAKIVLVGIPCSWLGLLAAQSFSPQPPIDIELLFSLFSLIVGIAILARTLNLNHRDVGRSSAATGMEIVAIGVVCVIGGIVTAWLSIGVGEILAVYMIFRGFRVNVAIGAAVTVTSFTVVAALPHIQSDIDISVLIYAAPGALIGGAIARRFAVYLGGRRLKLMMAVWIIISALVYLAITVKDG